MRMLKVVGHCKGILSNSCWQSLFLRVAKSHCFITNLIMLNCLFKSQFKELLTNEFLAFFFSSLSKYKFLRNTLTAEGNIIGINTRAVREVIVHVGFSLIRGEENQCLLAAACWQQDTRSGAPCCSVAVLALVNKPWPQISSHSVLPHLPSTLASQGLSTLLKFSWI